MYCSNCGKEIEPGNKFCSSCGVEIVTNITDDNNQPQLNEQETTYYKEYHFKSSVKGRSLEAGPITLVEGYSTKTDIIVDTYKMHIAKGRRIGKPKETDVNIDSIKSISSGFYFSYYILAIVAVIVGVLAYTPVVVGSSPTARLMCVVAIVVAVLFEMTNRRVIIVANEKVKFDSRDKEGVKLFVQDLKQHPLFAGTDRKEKFWPQKIILLFIVISAFVMVINPNPFAGSQIFEGTYQEWADAGYPSNYRTYILADVTTGENDTENDSIMVLAGESFEDEIWITNNKGVAIKDWKWLHDAEPVENNLAIFSITLTRFKNDSLSSKDKYFVFNDPVELTADELESLFGYTNNVENSNKDAEELAKEDTDEKTNKENATTESIDEMEIYSSVIKDAMSYSYAFYSLFDLDENGIKELILGYGDNNADFVNDVYSIDTELLPLYLGSFYSNTLFYEAEDGDGMLSVYGHGGYEYVTKITLHDGVFNEKEAWSKDVGEGDYYSNNKPIKQIELETNYSDNSVDNQFDYSAISGAYAEEDSEDIAYISIYSSPEGDGSVGNIEFPDWASGTLWDDGNGSTLTFYCDGEMYKISLLSESSFEWLWYNEVSDSYNLWGTYYMTEHFES